MIDVAAASSPSVGFPVDTPKNLALENLILVSIFENQIQLILKIKPGLRVSVLDPILSWFQVTQT